jgi:hypothetical protein
MDFIRVHFVTFVLVSDTNLLFLKYILTPLPELVVFAFWFTSPSVDPFLDRKPITMNVEDGEKTKT